ncbi:hypothetical protein PHMEG_00021692 [Phytophthora megakarya]|uniref:Uncharacterized protein n=1 Tax=Phytophthora megakarya TaxID=4795 RepID=A0A225VKZ9_9STRA|nr:hypothetical protein PHMEG_00021692 [Phytophthora megakarya]
MLRFRKTLNASHTETGLGISRRELARGMSIPQRLDLMCPYYERMQLLFGKKANISPTATLDLGVPELDDSVVDDLDEFEDGAEKMDENSFTELTFAPLAQSAMAKSLEASTDETAFDVSVVRKATGEPKTEATYGGDHGAVLCSTSSASGIDNSAPVVPATPLASAHAATGAPDDFIVLLGTNNSAETNENADVSTNFIQTQSTPSETSSANGQLKSNSGKSPLSVTKKRKFATKSHEPKRQNQSTMPSSDLNPLKALKILVFLFQQHTLASTKPKSTT